VLEVVRPGEAAGQEPDGVPDRNGEVRGQGGEGRADGVRVAAGEGRAVGGGEAPARHS